MSASNQHSELVETIREGLRYTKLDQTPAAAAAWALAELEEQLEAAQRELQDATRLIAALVYRTNKTSGVLLYPTDFHETLTLSRYENPMANTVHLFASNPAREPRLA